MEDLTHDVRAFAPLLVSVAKVESELIALKLKVTELDEALSDRDQQATDERRAVKVALIGLTATIMAALIAGIFAVAISGGK